MDFVQIDALKHRKLSGALLSRQLARLDWSRLWKLADDVLDFAQEARRWIRFGSVEPTEPLQPTPVLFDLSPDGIRRRLLADRAAAPPDDYVPSAPRM